MLLNNVKLLHTNEQVNISIDEGLIAAIGNLHTGRLSEPLQIEFTNAIAFPGLINSHDHLDFNCFHPFGNKKYNNYTEWGSHIHTAYKNEINAVLKIPVGLRTVWGMYKNLLAGVTTVVNHGIILKIKDPFIEVLQATQNLHSVKFQQGWKWKLNNPFVKDTTCVIHTGEGTDEQSNREIDQLIHWNIFNRKLVGIHGVAMNAAQAEKFYALVWCPESNEILLGQQPDIHMIKNHTRVVLGTDSTLTANWNIWDHMRLARQTKSVTDDELFNMVTASPATLWNCNSGSLQVDKNADLVIARSGSTWDEFYNIDPEDILLVMQNGQIRLFDDEILLQLNEGKFDHSGFSSIVIGHSKKYIEGNIIALIQAIRKYYPHADFPCRPIEQNELSNIHS